jgi:hypothetical protein
MTMARAVQLSKDINASLDQLNAAYASVEERLRKLNLGVSATVHIGTPGTFSYLGTLSFEKSSGDWDLWFSPGGENTQMIPIASASKKARLEAALYLQELVQTMLDTCESQTRNINESIAVINGVRDVIDEWTASRE